MRREHGRGDDVLVTKQLVIDAAVAGYVAGSCTPPDAVVRDLAARTAEVGDAAGMMATPEQATLLTLLTGLLRARVAVDVGTFTGLSALALARGVGDRGRVITSDVTDQWLDIARGHWARAGVADRIEFRLGAAGRTLRALADDGLTADVVFVDADKMNYPRYFEAAIGLLRPGGLLLMDNVLLDGHVLDPDLAAPGLPRRCAETLRDLNAAVAADDRVDAVMLPVADGLTVARKR